MLFTLSFLAGICTLQFFQRLPPTSWYFYLLGTSVFCLSLLIIFRKHFSPLPPTPFPKGRGERKLLKIFLQVLLFFSLGFSWMLWQSHSILDWQLPKELEKQDLLVTGTIVTLPIEEQRAVRFDFKVDSIRSQDQPIAGTPKIRLHWYEEPPPLTPGDEWQIVVRLKRPHGMANEGAFDYEKLLFQNRIRATGYVSPDKSNRLLSSNLWNAPFEYLRHKIRVRMNHTLKSLPYGSFLRALVMGDQSSLTDQHWDILRSTGTAHFVSISGLHITFVAGLVFVVTKIIWSLWPKGVLFISPMTLAALFSILAAFLYSAMAGFEVPTIRSLIMLASFMIAILMRRNTSLWQAFSISLFLVLVLDPLSTLSIGFWLSFGSVALILYTMQFRTQPKGLWWKWGRLHVLLAVGLIPLTILFFHQWSLVSPLANFIAIPWTNLTVIPLALLGTLFLWIAEPIGEWLLLAAHTSFKVFWPLLEFLGRQTGSTWHLAPPAPWTIWLALIGVILLLAPSGLYARWLGLVYCLPLWFTAHPKPSPDQLWFTLLDVGQGLSAVIQTNTHTLVYDTGPRYESGFNTGDAVLVPFLRSQGIRQVDTLLISHSDLDHMGGARALTQALPVKKIISGTPHAIDWTKAEPCTTGQNWQWQKARFTILHPAANTTYSDNNSSCVLKVKWGNHSILLTGDIEKRIEEELVVQYGNQLKSNILVVPHHGSASSSTEVFIQYVKPKVALFSAGYQNRFHFPKSQVTERLKASRSRIYNTAERGAIHFRLNKNEKKTPPPELYRIIHHRFWWE